MVELRDIKKSYGETEILKNANYIFPQKGLVCLLGPSGSGKTTLLNILAGFDTAYEGNVCMDEKNISLFKEDELCNYRKENIGFIFQDYYLLSGYTVLENILLPCDLYENEEEINLKKIDELLKKLGIESKKNEKIENLSGGQKQRVAIARALIKKPIILLADEPTGALDRENSNEIMKLLKRIAEDILIVVITHDKKICDFADEIIEIKDKKVEVIKSNLEKEKIEIKKKEEVKCGQLNLKKRAVKNFKVHIKQFIIVAIVIAVGISSFILALSLKSMMETSIRNFKEKNTVFNNGYIKGEDKDNILEMLKNEEKVSDAYYQYKLENISLEINGQKEALKELIPMPKTKEKLSYGVMPRNNEDEIAITPSLARKFTKNINELEGKIIKFTIGNYEKELKISGIYNAEYDSIFLSPNIEKEIYKKVSHDEKILSISYDVTGFEEVNYINDLLAKKNIKSINANEEVSNLISTFKTINKLFLTIAGIIFLLGVVLSIVLLSKLQKSRIREFGLLAALGFNKKQIKGVILNENIILAIISSSITLILIIGYYIVSRILEINITISVMNLIFSAVTTFLVISLISAIISNKIIKIEPAKALRM